jgi:hypothetical protein
MKKPLNRSQIKLSLGNHNALFQGTVKCSDGLFRLRMLVLDDKTRQTECIATLQKYTKGQLTNIFNGDPEKYLNKHFAVTVSKNSYNELLTLTSCKPKRFEVPQWFVKHCEDWQGCKNGGPLSDIKKRYLADRELKDPKFKITNDLRKITDLVLAGVADDVAIRNVGCTSKQFREHVESTFKKGMNWSNRGKAWHLDHKVPLTYFDLSKKSECLKAIHYTNFQALAPEENLLKYNSLPEPKQMSMAERIERYYAEQESLNKNAE